VIMTEGKSAGGSGAGHELSDLSPRAIAIFGIVLAATVIACLILALWIFGFFAAREAKLDVPPSPLAKPAAPAGPLLQVSAPKDLKEMRAAEEKILTSYDWVDRQAGTVRIPIDRAMQLLVERGLPTSQNESGAHGVTVGTGRTGQASQPAKAKR
jgi:hypothetical protein